MRIKAKQVTAFLLALSMTFVTLGCSKDMPAFTSEENPAEKHSSEETKYDKLTFTSAENLTEKYSSKEAKCEKTSVTNEFQKSYTDFALRLLRESRAIAKKETAMVSPLSVMLALEMTRSGAAGETEHEMTKTLYGGVSSQDGKQILMSYFNNLPNSKKAQLHLANSIWFRDESAVFTVDEDFLKACARDYTAEVFKAPFDTNTLLDINHWVEHKTDGIIKEIVEDIPEEAVMYLINTLTFDAEWKEAYTTANVSQKVFYPEEEGVTQRIKMMHSEERSFLKDDSAIGFVKPYAEGYEFVALLPNEGTLMNDYLSNLTGETFMNLMEQKMDTLVYAALPKFYSETSLSLIKTLQAMGMNRAFTSGQADFSGMGNGGENLYIGEVNHKTYIDVNELGTKAGAATEVGMESKGMPPAGEYVTLDRPFVYAIVDSEKKLPIFIGVLENMWKQQSFE